MLSLSTDLPLDFMWTEGKKPTLFLPEIRSLRTKTKDPSFFP